MNQPSDVVTTAIISASATILVAIIGALQERKGGPVEPGGSATRTPRPTLVFVAILALGFAITAGALIFWPRVIPPSPVSGPVVPVGTVIAYWGSTRSLPTGYELCDGKKVTTTGSPIFDTDKPDLGERFIRGAKTQVAGISDLHSGGRNQIQLSLKSLPGEFTAMGVADAIPRQLIVGRALAQPGKPIDIWPPYQELTYLIRVL